MQPFLSPTEEGRDKMSKEGTGVQKKRNIPIFMVGISLLQIGLCIYDFICIKCEGRPFGWDLVLHCRAHFDHLSASLEGACLGLIFLNKDKTGNYGQTWVWVLGAVSEMQKIKETNCQNEIFDIHSMHWKMQCVISTAKQCSQQTSMQSSIHPIHL